MAANNPDPYTPDMLEAIALALEGTAARIRGVQEVMKSLEYKELLIRNSKDMKAKGLPKITAFAQAAEDAVRDKRLGVK